jgi:hypothetical protein
MAIYSTIFLAPAEDLAGEFPRWKIPLAEPLTRTFVHPLFKEEVTVTSREPEWAGNDPSVFTLPEYNVVAIQGDYGAYLEARLPAFIRERAHWCGKGLTSVELDPLIAVAMGSDAEKLEPALFAHPSVGAGLDVFPHGFVDIMASANEFTMRQLAQRYAAFMSKPEFTHSVSGQRLQPDMTLEDGLSLLRPIHGVANQRNHAERMYLLVEA